MKTKIDRVFDSCKTQEHYHFARKWCRMLLKAANSIGIGSYFKMHRYINEKYDNRWGEECQDKIKMIKTLDK